MSATSDSPAQKRGLLAVWQRLTIGNKLTVGFGLLVALTLIVVTFSYLGSRPATENINRTVDVRFPTTLASTRSQVNLLRMLANVRGYLALGDSSFRQQYQESRIAFEQDLADLQALSPYLSPDNQDRLNELQTAFDEWSQLPYVLFELRDDQLAREPAYRTLATQGLQEGVPLLLESQQLIESLAQEPPSEENIELITDLALFQSAFASMVSGLRGYVTTRNRDFKVEYRGNLTANRQAWERIEARYNSLTPAQQARLETIATQREKFLQLPDEIFGLVEGEHWREDLYLFQTEAIPLATEMESLLNDMARNQQVLLQDDLAEGRQSLLTANQQTLFLGLIALVIGGGLALIFWRNITGPILRLTDIVQRIRSGDLEARAAVESGDEIGTLAVAFNNMTGKLQNTLSDVRQEKRRADDLLEVVIPIGVELTAQQDFNRLLATMLLEAKTFCKADAGILYLLESETLTPVIIANDTLQLDANQIPATQTVATIALDDESSTKANVVRGTVQTAQTLNIADFSGQTKFSEPVLFNTETPYRIESFLGLPLKNNQGHVLGVLALLNAKEVQTGAITRFDANLQQMMESFSLLAVAALEAYMREQSLKQEIQRLRIQIDDAKREQEVAKIVESDSFSDIQAKAAAFRRRAKDRKRKTDS